VPADSIGFWADRLAAAGVEHSRSARFGTERLHFRHPCRIHYSLVGDPSPDTREPYEGSVKAEHAIRGAYGTTTSVRESEPMMFFLTEGLGAKLLQSDSAHHQFQLGDDGHGRMFELAYSTPEGFLIDESEDELGTHMCIPPHWEDRRPEISQLEQSRPST